jgi:hypothetical protein
MVFSREKIPKAPARDGYRLEHFLQDIFRKKGKRMKRITLLLVWCLLLVQVDAFAQGGYRDDIYYSGSDAKREAEAQAERDQQRRQQQQQQQRQQQYQQSPDAGVTSGYDDGQGDYTRAYDTDEYIDYDDDPAYYGTNIRRFNYPFYNLGYYSAFYNPFWYNPYWVDPYSGWGWWGGPGVSISVGWGGPYWSSYWGWHTGMAIRVFTARGITRGMVRAGAWAAIIPVTGTAITPDCTEVGGKAVR